MARVSDGRGDWVLQPVGFTGEGEADCVSQEAVQESRCEDRVVEGLGPAADLLVGGDGDRGPLVEVADESEELVGLVALDRLVADLVDDEEVAFPDAAQAESRVAVGALVVEQGDEVAHFLEADGVALPDSVDPESRGEHCLPESRRAQEDEVGMGVHPGQLAQMAQLGPGQAALQFPDVELVQRLQVGREMGAGHVPPHVFPGAGDDFVVHDRVEEILVGHVLLLCLEHEVGEMAGRGLQAEPLYRCHGRLHGPFLLLHHFFLLSYRAFPEETFQRNAWAYVDMGLFSTRGPSGMPRDNRPPSRSLPPCLSGPRWSRSTISNEVSL